MWRKVIGVLVAAACLAGCGGRPSACESLGTGRGEALVLPLPLEEPARLGLSRRLYQSFNSKALKNWGARAQSARGACQAATMKLAEREIVIHGGKEDQPLRWAVLPDGRSIFLAALPPATQGGKAPVFALVGANTTGQAVLALYREAPSDGALPGLFADALDGGGDIWAIVDHNSRAVSLMVPTKSGEQVLMPKRPTGNGTSAIIFTADGETFRQAGQAVVMQGSGFSCPAQNGQLVLEAMHILDLAEATLDLGCAYTFEGGWITVFISRLPRDPEGRRRKIAWYADDIRGPSGGKPAAALIPLRGPDGPSRGGSWATASGQGFSVMMTAVGGYHVAVYATYDVNRRDAIAEAADALFKRAYREIDDAAA